MSEDVCVISDLPPVSCAHCRGDDRPVRTQSSHPFTAKFAGECAGCGFDVKVGDTVRFAHYGRLYHADHRGCDRGPA